MLASAPFTTTIVTMHEPTWGKETRMRRTTHRERSYTASRRAARTARGLAVWVAMATSVTGIVSAATPVTPVTPGIIQHKITAWVDPETAQIEVYDRIEIDGRDIRKPDQPFRFLLNKQLRISRVMIGEETTSWTESDAFNPKHFWKRPDYATMVHYAHAREVSISPIGGGWRDPSVITIQYAGLIDDTLHAPEEDYGRSFETTTGLIEARGAFLAGGTFWLPAVPDDMFRYDLTTHVPDEWDVVSQGELADRYVRDGHRITTWHSPHPMEEVYLVAGPYVIRRARHGDTAIYTYTYEPDDELTSKYINATADYLDHYEELIGSYPFAKFALVENFWQTGYGMPSFTLLGGIVIRLPFIVHTSYGHEILHNWWGNSVFVDVGSGNWCEGLTVYQADYAYKKREGANAAIDYRRNQLAGYLNYVGEQKDIPLSAFRSRHSGATQAIGYGKSMMVFHMLERLLGSKDFLTGLRRFYDDNLFRSASWDDLLRTFSAVSYVDLDWFGDQWIRRSGAPVISLGDVKTTHSGDKHTLMVVIEQEEPAYRLDVPLEIELEGGEIIRREIACERQSTAFRIVLNEAPRRVTIDPEFDLFRKLHREEIPPVLSQTLGADSTFIVLADGGASDVREAYRALADQWGREPGVRVADEAEVSLVELGNTAIWLFGDTRFSDEFEDSAPDGATLRPLVSELTGEKSFPPRSLTIVETRTHPTNPDLSWSWLRLSDPDVSASIGRKIPHYGKYSYLIFDDAKNVGKGTWRISASPLTSTIDR